MGLLRQLLQFGYDAVKPKGRRQTPTGLLRHEDAELLPEERRKVVSSSRDLHRNFALLGWMVRRHLDYITNFSFRAKTGNDALDEKLEQLIAWWSAKENCDVAGRHPLARMIRIAEARRTIDGDVFLLKTSAGRLQAIEGDRVRVPPGGVPDRADISPLSHGVITNDAGAAKAFVVCKRGALSNSQPGNSALFTFERIVPAKNMLQHAYFERFDQVRGISPLTAAINNLRDLYEGCDYALVKMKVSQLFALALFRGDPNNWADFEDADGEGNAYQIDLGHGPMVLDLNPGDRAEFMESKSPSTEFQAFTQIMISVALKALDIPYSFYAENFTNYSGARQALLQYQQAAEPKRTDNREVLDNLTAWRLGLFAQDGELPGVDVTQLNWEWQAQGFPWIDPLKEVQADKEAIGAGLSSRTRVLKEMGLDFYEIADERAAEEEYLRRLGISTDISPSRGPDVPSQVQEALANAR